MHADVAIASFWDERRVEDPALPEALPEAWAFGATPEHADALLALALAGARALQAALSVARASRPTPAPVPARLEPRAGAPRACLAPPCPRERTLCLTPRDGGAKTRFRLPLQRCAAGDAV